MRNDNMTLATAIHARLLWQGPTKALKGRIPGAARAVESAAATLGLSLPDRSWVPRRATMMGLCRAFARRAQETA